MLLDELLAEAVARHNVLPLTGSCNLSCCFCSHLQNPPGTLACTFPPLELSRLAILMARLNPTGKIIIGESATRLREGEPLSHPRFFEIMTMLRRRFPGALIQVTTNGSLLDQEAVAKLARLLPLELVLSLNSATVRGRLLLMGDQQGELAIAAARSLSGRGIPFHGSVVALPRVAGWEDLELTLRSLDRWGARTIRLLLPGYTRSGSPFPLLSPADAERCHALVRQLQGELAAPLLTEPPRIDDLDPVVEGVIKGTPAGLAGMRHGDQVVAVNGRRPFSRVEAFAMARQAACPLLRLKRQGKEFEVALNKKGGEPPGFAMSYDLDPCQVEQVRKQLVRDAETLMLVSEAAFRRWELARCRLGLDNLDLLPVPSRCFGGSINCAGLLTAGDFQRVIDQSLGQLRPARLLLPAVAFDAAGLDMQGAGYWTISTQEIPLRLVGVRSSLDT